MKPIFCILTLLLVGLAAMAQPSHLDSSFNSTGILTLNQAGAEDRPSVSLTRPNGKSLVIGYSYFDTRVPAATLTTVTVAQFDLNGKPDPSFGQNGIVVLDQMKTDASAADAILQPDGKLLITGKYLNSTSGPHHFVTRLNEDGTLDASFGANGIAGHPDPDLVAWGSALGIQPDGKIVMGGSKFTYVPPGSGYNELALIRFSAVGLVDSSFGDNGVVVNDFSANALAVAIDANGLVYVSESGDQLARFLPNGVLDSSFGLDGLVQIPDHGGVSHILIQPNGQVIVAGAERGSTSYKGFIRRLNQDGTIDATFENAMVDWEEWLIDMVARPDGKIMVGTFSPNFRLRVFHYWPNGQLDGDYDKELNVPLEGFYNVGLSLQPDGKIIAGGTYLDKFGFQDFSLLRLTEALEVDSEFGLNGYAIQNIGTNHSSANSILIDDQHRIVVGGEATYSDGTTIVNLPTVHSVGFVSRFQPNGSLDSTFWADGVAVTPIFDVAVMNLIVQQPDGKIISAGASRDIFNAIPNFSATRLLPDGTLDHDFGQTSGFVAVALDEGNVYKAYASAVAITPDNAIVVMGKVLDFVGQYKIALVRFDSNGWPDPSFGLDGQQYADVIPGADFDLNAGLIQPDGKILVAGTYTSGVPNIFVLRFMPDGTLDNSFGAGGVVLKPFTGLLYHLNGLAMQADGHILISGSQGSTTSNVIVGRLNPDGTRDNTFSGDGLALVNTDAVESGNALTVQADGKIVVAGYSANSNAAVAADPLLVRLLPNGTPDSSFAGTGYVVTSLPGANLLKALAIQSDGSYVTAGYSDNDYLLIRYLSKLDVGLLEEPELQSEVLVYPNPVQGQVTFGYTLAASSKVSLELFDIQGKRCHSFMLNETRPQGDNTEFLYFPQGLTPGVYILRVQTELGSRWVRVLVE